MKKISFRFLLVAILIAVGMVESNAQVKIGDLYYSLSDSTAEVIQNAEYSSLTNVVIPETFTYNDKTYTVTSIRNHAFYECIGLTSVSIPNSVTTIGISAFSGCTGLTTAEIPNSVTGISKNVFFKCRSLTTVKMSNSVKAIGMYAFLGCNYRLTSNC